MTIENLDRLSTLLERFRVRAHLFHSGALCGLTRFDAKPGRAFLHVLRRGELDVSHPGRDGLPRKLQLREPSLLFYPRPVAHDFHNPPIDGADFTCATLDFDGGSHNPLVRALPALVCLPLAEIEGLDGALSLLFAETETSRCGGRLLVERLLDVVMIQLLRWLLDHPQQAGVPSGLIVGLSDPRLARTLVALHESPGDNWSLPVMAAKAGMSRSAFAATFKDAVGQSPADYLADWRLTLAQTRLREGDSLKVITGDLGYANASALSRLFKQRTGVSARQWLSDIEAAAAGVGSAH